MFFARQEYYARWEKVASAMAKSGYDNLIVWQRSAGTFDRVGDIYWLTNYTGFGPGQEPASDLGAPYTFAAVLFRRGHKPELHIGVPTIEIDMPAIVCGNIFSHDNLLLGLTGHLRDQGIEGRVGLVGDDVLPGMYDRILRRHTPQIEWIADENFLLGPQSIKSARELEAFRIAGDIATRAMNAAMEALLTGQSGAEAAARASAIILRAGGGIYRIDVNHGPASERRLLSNDLCGYNTMGPAAGDMVRVWIYGPFFEGYWIDPGRSGICGNRPTLEQRALLEGAAKIVDGLVAAVAPGVTARELGDRGVTIAREVGYFDYPQLPVPLFGHGVGTNLTPILIPVGQAELPEGMLLHEPLQPGMVMAAEAFLTHTGVGTAGFEQVFIVTDNGAELLTKTPMLF